MTLVIARAVGAGEGIAIADKAVTTYRSERDQLRAGEEYRKIVHLGGTYFAAYTGSHGHGEELLSRLVEAVHSKELSYDQLIEEVRRVYFGFKSEITEDAVLRPLGLDWESYKSRKTPPDLRRRGAAAIAEEIAADDDRKAFDTDIMVCGIRNGTDQSFKTTGFSCGGNKEYGDSTGSLGSSKNDADMHFSTFLGKGRQRLPAYAMALMRTKRQIGRTDPSVGDRAQLVWVSTGNFSEATDAETRALDLALYLNENQTLLKKPDVIDIFERLVAPADTPEQRTARFEEIRKFLMEKVPTEDLWNVLLETHHL